MQDKLEELMIENGIGASFNKSTTKSSGVPCYTEIKMKKITRRLRRAGRVKPQRVKTKCRKETN